MPNSYVALPVEGWHSAGKKFRTQQRTVGGLVVESPAFTTAPRATFYLSTPVQACAGGKYFLDFYNIPSSGKIRYVEKLFIQNAQLTAIASGVSPATVGAIEFEIHRTNNYPTNGTNMNGVRADSADGTIMPYNCVYGATIVAESTLLYSWYTNNDEIGLTGAFPQFMYQAMISQQPEPDLGEFKSFKLLEGQGFCVKQITNYTLGQFAVLAVISEEDV